jgi:hypothetical protein
VLAIVNVHLWDIPDTAICRRDFSYISTMNFVICIYIQMNVILNMAVVVIYCYYGNRRVKVETLSWCVYYLGYINVSMNLLPFGTTKYGNLWSFNMMQSYVWCMCLVLLILLI